MEALFVVNNMQDWPAMPGVTVVPARVYLTEPAYRNGCGYRVINLCTTTRYQGLGYYVSLLAEARGHEIIPNVKTIGDLRSASLARLLVEELEELVNKHLAAGESKTFQIHVYFGRDASGLHGRFAQQIFDLTQAPLLRITFERDQTDWSIQTIRALSAREIPPEHYRLVAEAADEYLQACQGRAPERPEPGYRIAILHNPNDPEPPSNAAALDSFVAAAGELGMRAELVSRGDLQRIAEFDALFIRDTTAVDHYTYRFSRRAAAEGLVVIDDPDSILRCTNKVYLAELLSRRDIPSPRTIIVHRGNVDRIVSALGLPCVLKQPDGAFSTGVVKAESPEALAKKADEMLDKSELVIAQEYLATDFDWRVGVLDRRPLFACKYFMAPGHWQVIKHERGCAPYKGAAIAVPLPEVPQQVLRVAVEAANLIGDSLYGVDLKQIGDRCLVIEINDNPNVDAGDEDGAAHDGLYRDIMEVFLKRIEARGPRRNSR